MEAKELRVGNYYDHNGNIQVVTPNTILELSESERIWCKPIPLTEEWLLKFGFGSKYKSVHVKWNIGSFELDQKSDEDEYGNSIPQEQVFYFNYQLEIKYVHQLQNLWFSLKGEELILKE